MVNYKLSTYNKCYKKIEIDFPETNICGRTFIKNQIMPNGKNQITNGKWTYLKKTLGY